MDTSSDTVSPALNFDVLHHIFRTCYTQRRARSLIALSTTSRFFRAAAVPFIFRSIRMRKRWNVDTFQDLLSLQGIHKHVRSLTFFPSFMKTDQWKRAAGDGLLEELSDCATLLAVLLQSLPNLESLAFVPELSDGQHYQAVMGTLRSSVPAMPLLRTLRVPDDALFLCDRSPMVDSIFIDTRTQTHDWPHAPLLNRLAIDYMGPEVEEGQAFLRAIQERAPNVQSLTINNGSFSIEGLLCGLRSFPRLVTLALPALTKLDVDWHSTGWCGTGRRLMGAGTSLREEKKAAQNRVKAAAKAAFPRLKYLWIGPNSVFDFTRLGSEQTAAVLGDKTPSPSSECYGNRRLDELDEVQPIYVPSGQSAMAYIDNPACLRFSMTKGV